MGRNPGTNDVVTEWDRRRIKQARALRDVSLRTFAERLGCSHHTLWRIERGDISSTPLLRDIYRALRIPLRLMGQPDPGAAARALAALKRAR